MNKNIPYTGRSTDPKQRFSSHKSNANKNVREHNCGLMEFLINNCGGWMGPDNFKIMLIDGIKEGDIPKDLSKNDKMLWIFNKLEELEEKWRLRLHTYILHGLNKKGESNFKKWLQPKLREMSTKACSVKLKRLSPSKLLKECSIKLDKSEITKYLDLRLKEQNKTMVVRRSSRVKVKSAILKDEIWNTQ